MDMKTIEREKVDCPICGHNKFETVYDKEYIVPMNNSHYIWPTTQVICRNCGMVFTNPQPVNNVLKMYYSTTYNFYGEVASSPRIQQVNFMKKYIPSNFKRVLEIGAFNGYFLNLLKNNGYEVYGVEPSISGVKQAKNRFGIELDNNFFNEDYVESFWKEKQEKNDIVCFFHVLEHIKRPLEFLKLVKKVLRGDGYIFLEVPDAERASANSVADFFSIEHINHFTKTSLKNISKLLNFDIIAIDKPKEIPVTRVIYKINTSKLPDTEIENNFSTMEKIIRLYKKDRTLFLQKIKNKIQGYDKITVYGAGMHTSQIVTEGLLDLKKVDYIIDSNEVKWGKDFLGFKVSPPDILNEIKLPVLISSYDSQEDISKFLSLKYPNIFQIKLYNKVKSYNAGFF